MADYEELLVQGFLRRKLLRQVCDFIRLVVADSAGAYVELNETSPILRQLVVSISLCLNHGLRQTNNVVTGWFENRRTLWTLIENLPRSCPRSAVAAASALITSINGMRGTPQQKVRLWIMKSLMEKQLSDYLRFLSSESSIISDWFETYALIRNDDWSIFLGHLEALQGIECTFFLKENGWAISQSFVDDYLAACETSSSDSQLNEALRSGERKGAVSELANETTASPPSNVDPSSATEDIASVAFLQQRLSTLTDQNAYLEEVQRQLKSTMAAQEIKYHQSLEEIKKETNQITQERNQMQGIVLELQERLIDLDRRETDARKRLEEWAETIQLLQSEKREMQDTISDLSSRATVTTAAAPVVIVNNPSPQIQAELTESTSDTVATTILTTAINSAAFTDRFEDGGDGDAYALVNLEVPTTGDEDDAFAAVSLDASFSGSTPSTQVNKDFEISPLPIAEHKQHQPQDEPLPGEDDQLSNAIGNDQEEDVEAELAEIEHNATESDQASSQVRIRTPTLAEELAGLDNATTTSITDATDGEVNHEPQGTGNKTQRRRRKGNK